MTRQFKHTKNGEINNGKKWRWREKANKKNVTHFWWSACLFVFSLSGDVFRLRYFFVVLLCPNRIVKIIIIKISFNRTELTIRTRDILLPKAYFFRYVFVVCFNGDDLSTKTVVNRPKHICRDEETQNKKETFYYSHFRKNSQKSHPFSLNKFREKISFAICTFLPAFPIASFN